MCCFKGFAVVFRIACEPSCFIVGEAGYDGLAVFLLNFFGDSIDFIVFVAVGGYYVIAFAVDEVCQVVYVKVQLAGLRGMDVTLCPLPI